MIKFRPRICEICGAGFQPRGNKQKTCGAACTLALHSAPTVSGCREWTGCKHEKGYGTLRVEGRHLRAHRAAWEVANGPIPKGLLVLHSCDNPACIALDHLSLGTPAENTADMLSKRRNYEGEECSWSILTENDVRFIKSQLALKTRGTKYRLAKKFGVSFSAIADIEKGKNWRLVEADKAPAST